MTNLKDPRQGEGGICILCTWIGPYHAARYKAIQRLFEGLTVIEVGPAENRGALQNAAATTHLPVYRMHTAGVCEGERVRATAVYRALSELRPVAVVSIGYSDRSMRAATRWARQNRALSVMSTDTWAGDKQRHLPLEWAKAVWCRSNYDALFLPGIRSAEYFRLLGYQGSRIWRGVAVVDNDHFAGNAAATRLDSSASRRSLSVPERYFLTCARLAPEKNVRGLIDAFLQYRRRGGSWSLVIVGDGAERAYLEALAVEGRGNIHFAGWQPYDRLPAYYGLASCFVLSSVSEPWGLVVNEAMACGLPVIVSRKCGCQPELCWRGINGYDFDPSDVNALADAMAHISNGTINLQHMGASSKQIISRFTPATCARALADCINSLRAPNDSFRNAV